MIISVLNQAYRIGRPGLAQNIAAMGFYRALADKKLRGYLLVIVFFNDQFEDKKG